MGDSKRFLHPSVGDADGLLGEGTVPARSCRAAAVPARAVGSVDVAPRDLQVGRRVAAAHLEQLTARVAEPGGRAVPGRLVGHRPADGGLAASHRPASSSPAVQQPLGEPEPPRPAGAVAPRAWSSPARRAAAKTRWPVSARRTVVARPIPPEAPVTRMNRWSGRGAGLAGTGVAWVVMGQPCGW
jgi:hypothetical protein